MDPKWLSCRKVNEGRWGNEKLVKYFPERYKKGEPIKQWTTKLGEEIVRSILERNKNHRRHRMKNFRVDFETDDALWEVKTRNYSTSGTVGEKIFGTVWKYSDLPRIHNKPLYIVLVGYQEFEARNKFGLFDSSLSEEKRKFLEVVNGMNIHFVGASELIGCE